MASETVKRILQAEAEANRKNTEARKRSEEIVNEASGGYAKSIQKRLGDATAETARKKAGYDSKLEEYRKSAEAECQKALEGLMAGAEKNMDGAVDAIIRRFF